MKQPALFLGLDVFAKQCINSQKYPNDDHTFFLYSCNSCKAETFRLTVEHHTGSREGDFKGIIWGECAECGYLMQLFSFTGEHRKRFRDEKPICECGKRTFSVALCERIEGEQGIPGFFDEGVVAGKCAECKRNHAFVFTD